MMALELIGHIGNDAQVKNFNGKDYIAFNVAHGEKFKNQQGVETERTTWISCLKPGNSGVVQYLKKGTPVFVRGDLSVKVFTDSQHQAQAGVNCLVRELQLLPGGKREQNLQQGCTQQPAANALRPQPAAPVQPSGQLDPNGDNPNDLPF